MASRSVTVLSVLGAAILLAVAVLHGSGYDYVAGTVQQSDLPEFLKRVLPLLYLYPSALMFLLALAVLATLRRTAARAPVLALVCVVVAANSVLGFVLGGAIPGAALLLVAGLFAFASLKATEDSAGVRT